MRPGLEPGDHILVDPSAYRECTPESGDILVAHHPFEKARLIVKRVRSVDDQGRCFLIGDNPDESTDSHAFAALAPELIVGRVTRKIP